MLNDWRSDLCAEIGVGLAVRGVMTANEHPVSGRWMPIRSAKNQIKTYDSQYFINIQFILFISIICFPL